VTTVAAAVGPATARAARAAFGGDITVLHPSSAQAQDSEALWDVIVREPQLPRRVLLVRGQVGREWLGEKMRECGIEVQAHVAYEREVAAWPPETLRTLREWAAQGVRPVWLLTSAEGIAATLDQAQAHGLINWCRDSAFVVTHPRLTGVLQQRLGEGPQTPLISTALPEDDAVLLCFEQIREHASLC
jgi:uroporphyrinogen-III synthase